jgi:hypothetical protein
MRRSSVISGSLKILWNRQLLVEVLLRFSKPRNNSNRQNVHLEVLIFDRAQERQTIPGDKLSYENLDKDGWSDLRPPPSKHCSQTRIGKRRCYRRLLCQNGSRHLIVLFQL